MRDLNDVLDLVLQLPIGGKTYTVNPPDRRTGAHLLNRLAFGIAADAGIELDEDERRAAFVTDDEMPDFARQCLGPALDEMEADGLDHARIEFCVTTAFYAWTVGKAFAETYWETGGNLERPTVQSQEPPTGTPTRPAEASTSPISASASGTSAEPSAIPA
jgi:hypothetical protein